MMLADLVPPFELCKQIPEGAFEDSALVWQNFKRSQHGGVFPRECWGCREHSIMDSQGDVPAPTFEEIEADFYERGAEWLESCVYYDGKTYDRPGCAHTALELWLKLFGNKEDIWL